MACTDGSSAAELGGVRLDPGGPELGQRAHRRLGHAGVLPDPGGDPDHRGLLGVEVDRGQLELAGPDPVAGLVVEEGVEAAHLDRHPESAELVLVPLEGPLEGGVAEVVVALDRLADPALGEIAARDQEADGQVEDSLGLAGRRHGYDLLPLAVGRCCTLHLWGRSGREPADAGHVRTSAGAGRYAPSPTGELHLGNLRTAVLAWLFARSTDRRFLLRIEDLDATRVRPGHGRAAAGRPDRAGPGLRRRAGRCSPHRGAAYADGARGRSRTRPTSASAPGGRSPRRPARRTATVGATRAPAGI